MQLLAFGEPLDRGDLAALVLHRQAETGQDSLTVPSMEAKASAHVAGLGVGFLPRWIAEREAQAGNLVILEVAATQPVADALVAWRQGPQGKGLKWFIKRLEDPLVAASLLS